MTTTNSSVDFQWILQNLGEVIIYKDFDVGSLNFEPLRILDRITIENFDIKSFKDEIYLPSQAAGTISEKVLSILLNSNVRRGSLSILSPYVPILLERIDKIVKSGQPITLLLPAMPHKKQTPITTGHSLDFIDLGEYACFQQLKNILHSISRVYTPGAKIVLIPDGVVFAHLFAQDDVVGVKSYRNKLSSVLKQFGLIGLIEILDLQEIVSTSSNFFEIKEGIRQQLGVLESANKEVREGIAILKKAMFFNIPFSHSMESHLSLMGLSVDRIPKNIIRQLEFAAFEYVSILLALKRLNLFENLFPESIRLSVHSKKRSSIPLNLINDTSQIFPYNGIPVVRMRKYAKNHNLRTSIRIMRLYEIYKYPSAVAVYIEGQQEPFYYEIQSLRECL